MSKLAKIVLLISVLLLLVAANVFGLTAYWVTSQGELLSEQITALANERSQESSFLRLQRTYDDTIEERQQLRSYHLESDSNSIDFLNLIEGIAPEAGVNLTTNQLDSVVDESDGSQWVEAGFVFSGTRGNVQNFVKVLENLPYVVRINRVSLDERSTSEWEAAVTIQAKVLSYDQ